MSSAQLKKLWPAALACVLLSAGLTAHAEVDALVRQANALVEQGKAPEAFGLLEPQEAARAGDADFDTVLGIAANESGQFTRAVFALERVLAVQPGNARARAELGRALFSVGDFSASRKVLLETKQGNIPPEAAASIDEFLRAIDRAEDASKSSLRLYLETTLGNDSNINSGPGNANVAVPAFGGAVFTLNNSGVAVRDNFVSVGAGISGRQVIDPRWSLIGNLTANIRGNFSKSGFDSTQIDANLGASYRYDQHEFSGVVQLGTYAVDGSRARDQAGLVGEWTYRIDGFRQLSSYVQWGELSYPGQSARDSRRTVVGTSYAQATRGGTVVFGGVYFGNERPKNGLFPQFGHQLFGLRTGISQELGSDLSGFASLSYEERNYGGVDPLFLVTRKDRQTNFGLGLNWVPAKSWRVTPQLSLTSTRSNVAISDFNRSVLSVTVRRDF